MGTGGRAAAAAAQVGDGGEGDLPLSTEVNVGGGSYLLQGLGNKPPGGIAATAPPLDPPVRVCACAGVSGGGCRGVYV